MVRPQLAVVCGLMLLAACGPAEPGPGEEGPNLGTSQAPIISGYVDYGHPNVGQLAGCTATLVGRRTVLTAAHCVFNGQRVRFCSNGHCAYGTAYVHPSYSDSSYQYDLSVVRLDFDLTAASGIAPSRIASWGWRPSNGMRINIVGYGCTKWDTTEGNGTRRQGWNSIDEVNSNLFQYDDSQDGAVACQGDSGGPVFRNDRGDCQIGITSHRQAWLYGGDWISHRVDVTFDWIRQMAADSSVLECGEWTCGDGVCSAYNESHSICPTDCPAVCGNSVCEGDEQSTCPGDCQVCGDGTCGSTEDSASCPGDCPAVCGNRYCESGEQGWCDEDCGTCVGDICPY